MRVGQWPGREETEPVFICLFPHTLEHPLKELAVPLGALVPWLRITELERCVYVCLFLYRCIQTCTLYIYIYIWTIALQKKVNYG